MLPDGDRPDDALGLRAREIDRQQTIPQIRTLHLDPVCQHEHPLELTRRDTAVEILPGLVILLPAVSTADATTIAERGVIIGLAVGRFVGKLPNVLTLIPAVASVRGITSTAPVTPLGR